MEKKKENRNYDTELRSECDDLLLDYHEFNLKALAEKIRLQTVKLKPKMIFY